MPPSRPTLVSFADGAFAPRHRTFELIAKQSGFFSRIHVYNLQTLPVAFRVQHGDYMQCTPRGFGYWIWKPQVILSAMETSDPDEIIVYMDAGFTMNSNGRDRFREYVEITRDHNSKMLSFMNVFTEAHWSKADLLNRLGLSLSSIEAKTSQLGSGLIILQNTRRNLAMVQDWANIAISDNYRFSDDSPSTLRNHNEFQEHRHDQSISSLLRKLYGTAITHYEVQSYQGRFEQFCRILPAWATRSRA